MIGLLEDNDILIIFIIDFRPTNSTVYDRFNDSIAHLASNIRQYSLTKHYETNILKLNK